MVRMRCAADLRVSAVLPEARLCNGPDVRLASCTWDARRVRPGDIFVPIVDGHGDGHFDAALAVDRGASAIVAERLLPVNVPLYLVEDTRDALGKLCQHVVSRPSHRLCTVGVAGTSGKTTTALLLAAIFRAAGGRSGWATSLGSSDGVEPWGGACHDWSAPEFARRLADMEAAGCQAAVLEVDGRSLAERRTSGIALDAAIVTNVGRGDSSWRCDERRFRGALHRWLGQLKPDGLVVLNGDDPLSDRMCDELPGPALRIGMESDSHLFATVIERHVSEQTFLLSAGAETLPIRTTCLGDHHVMNCLAAAAAGLALGIEATTVVRGLESVRSVPGRLERVECGQPFSVFIDGGATVGRLERAIGVLRPVTRGRVICVYGPTARTPRAERSLLGRTVERHADYGIITSNDPEDVPVVRIHDDVLDGYQRPARAHFIPDRRRAIRHALDMARPGDTVLIAGKGERQGQTARGRTMPFDDAEEARRWLLGGAPPDEGPGDRSKADSDDEPIILKMFPGF